MIHLDAHGYADFAARLQIPSKDHGLVPLHMWSSQRYFIDQIAAGLAEGVHDFVVLKGGRQIGITTANDVLDLWWPQSNHGTQGMLVSDDDDNRDYRRDVLLQMLESLPRTHRHPVRLNNRGNLAWANGSRLMFTAAGKRASSNLGRSRGVNYLHADECGTWPSDKAVSSLRAALSEQYSTRLYVWNSTAQGIGSVFHEMVKTAQTATTQRFIFIAWWRRDDYVISRSDPRWAQYGANSLSDDESLWVRLIKKRYQYTVTREQIAWYRWKLAEQFFGDEVMMAQEFGSLPEECFQAFGDKFIPQSIIRRERVTVSEGPKPIGYRYEWGETLDATSISITRASDAPLRVWEEPAADGVYVVAGHPAWSSSPAASEFIAQVWRVWPDRMAQVGEYSPGEVPMYHFAWALLHLAGAYRTFIPAYFIIEVGGTGRRVLSEIQLLERQGYGLSPRARGHVQDFLGSVRHYYYQRVDNVSRNSTLYDWKTQVDNRPQLMHGLRDTLERGHMVIRSEALLEELSALRRGETIDADQIEGASNTSDARAVCAALAVECWLNAAMPDLSYVVAPSVSTQGPNSAGERLVRNYMQDLLHRQGNGSAVLRTHPRRA